MPEVKSGRPRGRPREFDEAAVLDGAIALFSAVGFTAASIGELGAATGLATGSLYKAFRDKEDIFARALERHAALRDAGIADAFEDAGTGRDRIARLLALYADLSSGASGRGGCMVVGGITELDQLGGTAALLRGLLRRRHDLLTRLVRDGQADGSVSTTEPAETVAAVLLALLQGMRVLGKGDAFPADADGFVRQALRLLD